MDRPRCDSRQQNGITPQAKSTNGHAITVTDRNGVVTVSGLAADVTIERIAAGLNEQGTDRSRKRA
jgi:hypothetical protein